MSKSRINYKTKTNYAKVKNFVSMGCTTSEIAKFMNLSYNQAWYLRKDVVNKNQREALELKEVKHIMAEKPSVKTRVAKNATVVKREVTVKPENVKVLNNGNGLTITVTIAI